MSRHGKLVCLNGPQAGREYDLSDTAVILGRSQEADVVLQDQFASRQHAKISMIEGAYQISDLGSKNGVVLNGRRIEDGGYAWLEDGSEFHVNRFSLP